MRETFVNLITERITSDLQALKQGFETSLSEVGVRYCVIDELLPEDLAHRIQSAFPEGADMRFMDTFRERKWTSKDFDRFDPILSDITFAIQDARVIRLIEDITGITYQRADPTLYAGGLSSMGKGHFLAPHIDNSHDASRAYYRTMNLLYYVTSDWSLENGGNLELWDKKVTQHTAVVSRFNRLVIMETNPWSWHSVSEVKVDRIRKCVSNYYFSLQSPTGDEYFNVTTFSARPEQRMRRALASLDGKLRRVLRLIAPQGFGKKDIYEGPK